MKLVFVGFRQTKGTCSPSTILLLRRAEYRTTGARLPKCNSPKDSKPLRKRRQSRPRSTEDGRFSNRTRMRPELQQPQFLKWPFEMPQNGSHFEIPPDRIKPPDRRHIGSTSQGVVSGHDGRVVGSVNNVVSQLRHVEGKARVAALGKNQSPQGVGLGVNPIMARGQIKRRLR